MLTFTDGTVNSSSFMSTSTSSTVSTSVSSNSTVVTSSVSPNMFTAVNVTNANTIGKNVSEA